MVDIYYRIEQLDGRVENYHLNAVDADIYLDLLNELIGKAKVIETITEYEFLLKNKPKIHKVALHQDLHVSGDAMGECLGYIEHYALP